ncbi:MAG TPA: DUF938 domain-containing protein [Marinagarivorans sp.]
MNTKPFSQACENNKGPILSHLKRLFSHSHSVLEIGSGTGQHAVHFATMMPQLTWQTSDRPVNHDGINAWIDHAPSDNIKRPVALDVECDAWPQPYFDAVYSANTAHIMPWSAVEAMFYGIGKVLCEGGIFALYGPFNYDGHYTSTSNAQFDEFLRASNPQQGIRDFEAVCKCASGAGLHFKEDNAMPANNRLLVWCKQLEG